MRRVLPLIIASCMSIENLEDLTLKAEAETKSTTIGSNIPRRNYALHEAYIVSSADGGIPSDASKNVSIDQQVNLYALVYATADGLEYYLGPSSIDNAIINHEKRTVTPASEEFKVTWFKIEPVMYHIDGKSPNPGMPSYSNSKLYGKNHGAWLGFDPIQYISTEIPRECGFTLKPNAHPTDRALDTNDGLGTMRYQVKIQFGNQNVASPGAQDTNYLGIKPSVHRISFRLDDSFIGYLTSFFNVPEVFGSDGPSSENHQTELFTGTDCADILVGTARLMESNIAYTYVDGLKEYTYTKSEHLLFDVDGNITSAETGQSTIVRFGEDIQVGDILPMKWLGLKSGRSYEHVGVVVADLSDPNGMYKGKPNGVLDAFDLIGHLGHYQLKIEPIFQQVPFKTQIWKWKPKVIS